MDFHHESDFSYSCRNRRDFFTSWIFRIRVGFSTLLHNWLCLPACSVWSLGPANLCQFDASQSLASVLFHLLWAWKLPQNLVVSKMNIYFANESSVCAGLCGDSWCWPHTASAGVAWSLRARIFWRFTHISGSWCWILAQILSWILGWNTLHVASPCGGREVGGERERENFTISSFTVAWQECSITFPGFYSLRVTRSLPGARYIDFPTWWGVARLWRSRWDWKYCCRGFGGCILPHVYLWFPSLPEPALHPSSHLSWHLLPYSFIHCWLWLRLTGRMGHTLSFFTFSCPNKVIKVTTSTWRHWRGMPKPRKMSAKSGASRFSSLVSKNS